MAETLQLSDLTRLAGEQAHRVLLEMRDEQLTPMYLLVGNDGVNIIACPWRDEADKAAMIAEVKRQAAAAEATALSFLSEVWMTSTAEAPDAILVRPSEHPKRREYVFVAATDGKRTETARWQIIRDRPGGSIIALLPEPTIRDGSFSGRMIDGILP